MDNSLRSLLKDLRDIELSIEQENGKLISLKAEIFEIINDTKFAILVPVYNGRRFLLDMGRRVNIFFGLPEGGILSFKGLIVNRELDRSPPILFIQMISPIKKTQRREFFRMPVILDVVIKIPSSTSKEKRVDNGKLVEVEKIIYKEVEAVAKDLSGGGLRTLLNSKIDTGKTVKIDLKFPSQVVEVDGRVVRCNVYEDGNLVRYDIGIQFENLEEKNRSIIVSYVFEKQRNLRKKGLV